MPTLIEKLTDLRDGLTYENKTMSSRTVSDAIVAVAERDKLHADIETLRLELLTAENSRADLAAQVEHYRGETRAAKVELAETHDRRDEWRKAYDRAQAAYYDASRERDVLRKQNQNAEPYYGLRPAPPSHLNLMERVARLEREVLFVRQRPRR